MAPNANAVPDNRADYAGECGCSTHEVRSGFINLRKRLVTVIPNETLDDDSGQRSSRLASSSRLRPMRMMENPQWMRFETREGDGIDAAIED